MAANPGLFTGLVGSPVYSPSYFARSFQSAQDRANRANEKRYQEALSEARRLRSNMIAAANMQGNSQVKDINQAYQNQGGQVLQNLSSRGLMSSTVAPTMQMGVQRERLQALGRLRESLAQQRAQADQAGTGQVINLLASKHDNGPDPAMLATMMQAYGASGAGSATPAPPQFGFDPSMALLQQMANQPQMPTSPMQPMGIDRAAINRYLTAQHKQAAIQAHAIQRNGPDRPPGFSPWAWWERPAGKAQAQAAKAPPKAPAQFKPSMDYYRAATQPGMFRWTPWSYQTQGWNRVPTR